MIWNKFGSSLSQPDRRCASCRTSMTRTRRLQLLHAAWPSPGTGWVCFRLAGNGRLLGHFRRLGCFLWPLVSYGSCEQKLGRVRELRVTFYGPFKKIFFLRAKLVSKYMFIGMWWKLCTGREELLWEMSPARNAWGGHRCNSLLWWVHRLPGVTFRDVLVQEAKQLGFLQGLCQSFPHHYLFAVALFALIRNHSYYLIFLYSYFCTLH